MTWNKTSKWLVPAAIIAIGGAGSAYLARQDVAVKVDDKGVPVAPTVAAGPPKASVGGQAALPPGAVIRSLDKINEAASAVGCPTLVPNDPAGKLLDVSECLGEKAMQAQKK